MPNHDRFECQTAIDSDAILQLITLNLPDGQKTTIEGEWRHMSDANRLSERITMLQHAIYEQYEEYRADIPVSWSR
ncbi:hypothetical protein [Escherichia coli]|uniref:hypothetical protein n=1 Tax=Escherichia coli TaxID=562 RepID=UPI000DDE9618|nr:hypothetical protein [Escherichia coli]